MGWRVGIRFQIGTGILSFFTALRTDVENIDPPVQ
jgi:hypothetical protein